MSKFEMLGYFFVFVSMSLSMGLYKLEIRNHPIDKKHEYIKKQRIFGDLTKYLSIISIISLVILNFKLLIAKDYNFIVNYGSVWLFFFFFPMFTGFCQKRDSVSLKRSLIAIASVLFGMIVFSYAFRQVPF